ncbi:MAG TPA: sigma-54 dependent transcriptional regulator [Bacteroidota bacterium]|nr:sigma-54 dependent transcriptional regulator [Bacteroidota bacterium]
MSFSRQFLVGKSRAFVAALDNILKVSNVHSPVLITGETGTGKELFARAVHYLSRRSGNAFIPLNCGALHEHLFENELFGHVKGAYTGAGDSREGVVNDARGGTLFLDEINTLSTLSQVKLLRFLEDKTYRKLGSSNVVEADIRIVSATNANLDDAVKADKFREDLLYRINALTIELPPLRDRNGDIPLLADHFLRQFCLENERPSIYVSDAALKKLSSWRWPGNVRELKNVVNKAAVMCNSNIIRDADICVGSIREDNASGFTYKQAKDRTLERFEKEYVAKLLNMSAWNISQASKSAQMSRQSFYRLIKKHNIPIQEEGSVTSVIR